MSRREIMIALLGLVTSGAGVGVRVEKVNNYSYDAVNGKPANVKLESSSYELHYDLIESRDSFKPRTGAAGVLLQGGEINR